MKLTWDKSKVSQSSFHTRQDRMKSDARNSVLQPSWVGEAGWDGTVWNPASQGSAVKTRF